MRIKNGPYRPLGDFGRNRRRRLGSHRFSGCRGCGTRGGSAHRCRSSIRLLPVVYAPQADQAVPFFHAWEYGIAGLLALLFLFYDPIFLAIVLAHLGHVATDQFHNGLDTRSYFITYRALIKFDAVRITGYDNVHYAYTVWPGLLPFGERLGPWYVRKIEPWFRSRLND